MTINHAHDGRTLLTEERQRYDRDGFVVVPDVFPADELATIDDELDRMINTPGIASEKREGWIFDLHSPSAITRGFAEDGRLQALIEDIVQPGIAIHSSKLVTKLPYTDDICLWHQDEAFYRKPDPATHSKTRMSVWVPLQAADERNGCLWVVPGSHRWGLEDYTWQDHDTCRKQINRHEYADRHAVPLPVRAGSVVLFSAWTWHHSKNNHTGQTRRAFIVSYQEATVLRGQGQQRRLLRPAPATT